MTLAYLIHRTRRDIPFHCVFLALGLFIIACGATHFMEVWTLWTETYWLSGYVDLVTAAASVATAVILPPLIPRTISLVQTAELSEERRLGLEEANLRLESEIVERTRAEEELRTAKGELEVRVAERTAELRDANEQLHRELAERRRAEEERDRLLVLEQAARREAEEANRLKDEFFASVSGGSNRLLFPSAGGEAWGGELKSPA